MSIQKWQILFSGHVQGVGFRFTTYRFAQQHEVVGWVKNLTDGRVELQVQGEISELAQLLESIEQTFCGNIREREKSRMPVEPGLSSFEIRH